VNGLVFGMVFDAGREAFAVFEFIFAAVAFEDPCASQPNMVERSEL